MITKCQFFYSYEDLYDKQAQAAWHGGKYENFEVKWSRGPPDYSEPYRPDTPYSV